MTSTRPERVDDAAALFARHQLALVRLARQLVDDLDTAQDVVQDVFAAWPATPPADPIRYLRTAVVNRCRSALRRRRTVRLFQLLAAPVREVEPADADLLRDESSRELLGHVDALPRRQREVVVLRYYEQLRPAEIAEVLGISTTAVSTSLSRALAALAGRIEENDYD